MQLEGKTAIVTGASSGIGRAAALRFAQEGAAVVVGARRRDHLANVVNEIAESGGQAEALAGDVRDGAYAKDLVSLAVTRFGSLDIALNNAGTLGDLGSLETLSEEGWAKTIDTNLTSAFLAAKHQLPALKETRGSLIFTSSFVGHTAGMPGMAAYAASKAGIIGMAQCLAAEYGPQGVRVNSLLPGGTDTPMSQTFADSPDTLAAVRSIHALKRIADPEEIAAAALFLASSASSFVTGAALIADGGVSINRF